MPPLKLTGIVTRSGFMQKTATVTISRFMVHPKTHKRIERSKKYLTHDPENVMKTGDTVMIRHCRPISARKRFVLDTVIKSPETEWEKLHANQQQGQSSASQGNDGGGAQGPLDVTAGVDALGEVREGQNSTPSKMAEKGMAGVS
ncbi:hypothetical protein Clacol_003186 [Clathrus columnatus]|uniref:Nucleic acid-binding protein n=1 Tax=Clathrus columnatus TaxID=1419009 RepID=A0AAV5AAK6_9AGAM|nr:hypothetical protein Clacol_003186 [Clathrus columnatus]